MPTVSKTIEFAASPEDVWAAITDFGRYGEWNVTHVGFPDGAPADVSAGATFKEKVRIMGMPGEVAWSVDRADAPSRLTLSGKGPMGTHMKYEYTITTGSGCTQLDLASEFGGAALGPMEGALAKETDKALGESVARLQALVT